MHQLLPPTDACRALDHRIDTRTRTAGTGSYEYCVVCTLGYEMALTNFDGDEDKADDFVRDLRSHA